MAKTEQADTQEQTQGQNAEFTETQDVEGAGGEENLDVLLDINMPITVNIGKSVVPFRRLLQLGPGSVLQLDKTIGQPAELYIQDVKFATGDIVVVDGCFAVRVKEILGMDQTEQAEEQLRKEKLHEEELAENH